MVNCEGGKTASGGSNSLAQALRDKLDEDQLTNCMRCGFCLPACPTFRETGVEPESPRGRIALMKAVADGIMEPDEAFRNQMNHCLGCRACEPVCPADVKYGKLLEQARDALEKYPQHSGGVKLLRKLFFRGILPHRNRLQGVGKLLRFYQKSGLVKIARGTGVMRLFPKHLQEMERILPEASAKGVADRVGTVIPAKGRVLGRVGLFSGCIMDVLFSETNVNTAHLLTEAGFEVVIPPAQGCCGALHAHSGELDQAHQLARRNIAAFKQADVDYIVSNAGGCGAMLVEYDHLLAEDEETAEDAKWFAAKVIDVSRLIVEKGRLPEFRPSTVPTTVTYQDSCHLRNVMRSGEAPRLLLNQMKDVTFIEMKEADRCCGSAGIYNVVEPEMAGQLLEHKMEHANATGASYILTSNPGCLLQMQLGVERHGQSKNMQAMHIVDFLAERLAGTRS